VDTAAIGAVLTGLGSLISALGSLWFTQRKMRNECDRRVDEVEKALVKGIEIGRE
jgi:hypothetical protein